MSFTIDRLIVCFDLLCILVEGNFLHHVVGSFLQQVGGIFLQQVGGIFLQQVVGNFQQLVRGNVLSFINYILCRVYVYLNAR